MVEYLSTYTYLLKVTFCVDTAVHVNIHTKSINTDLYKLTTHEPISAEKMTEIFETVNKLLNENDANTEFPVSYDNGMNIDTLMEGIRLYTKGEVTLMKHDCKELNFDNYYVIEQWLQI